MLHRAGIRCAIVVTLVAVGCPTVVPLEGSAATPHPFQDPSLSVDARVQDLLGRLTRAEKLSLLHQYQPAVPRLGLPAFKTGTEALHGVAWSNDPTTGAVVTARATAFPQALGLASTWDPDLVRRVGGAVADEARGHHARNPSVWGLNLWAPVVNPLRDPRWGRNEEGYSEDPTLTATIATAYGRGLQGDDPMHLKTAPTLKHYLAYNNEVRRDTTSSDVPQRVLDDYDRQAFRPVLAADAATGVMASYNLVNGRPAHVNPELGDLVRGWTDTPLFHVTDAGAPYNLTGSQDYHPTQPEANAAMLRAGINSFTMDGTDRRPLVDSLTTALSQGLITEADVDGALAPAISLRVRLGDLDPDGGPHASIGPEVIDSAAHRALAREAAGRAMVLLRNPGDTLPLPARDVRRVAVTGPLADSLFTDWYGGALPYQVTPLAGIRDRLGSGGTVAASTGTDRIALRAVTSGAYVTVNGSTPTVRATAGTTTSSPAAQFDVTDWGEDVVTLRSVGSGMYLGTANGALTARDAQPNGWYVQQQFSLEPQPDGSVVLRYRGYDAQESWFRNTYVTLGADGTLTLGATSASAAARFTREVVTGGVDSAVADAEDADAAVVVVGSMPLINGREIRDRATLALAPRQQALVDAVRRVNPRTVVVLVTSYPVTMPEVGDEAPAVLWTTHAGAETGHALADVIFGDVDPAGRVTQTWYRSDRDLPQDLLEYDIVTSRQTYLYHQGIPLYPFGHGLSYSTFRHANLRLSAQSVDAKGTVTVSVDVTNTGGRAAEEVVQVYTHQRTSRDVMPIKQLRAFRRVRLAAGQTDTVQLALPAADLGHWDVTRGRRVVETSDHDVLVGSSSGDIRQEAVLRVEGETIPPRDLSGLVRAESFDARSGVRLVPETRAAGTAVATVVGAAEGASWLAFRGCDLGAASRIDASVARAAAGMGAVEVRLDSETGPLAGTVAVPSTGDVHAYVTVGAALAGATGRRDVYLVFRGDLRLGSFSLS